MISGLPVTTQAVLWLCQPPPVEGGFAGTLPCAEAVQQEPRTVKKINAWLMGGGIHLYGMIGYRRWLPVLFPLYVRVHRCQIWPDWMSWWKSWTWRWVIENISMNWAVFMALYFGQHLVHGWLLMQVWWSNWVCVGRRHHEISRMLPYNWESIVLCNWILKILGSSTRQWSNKVPEEVRNIGKPECPPLLTMWNQWALRLGYHVFSALYLFIIILLFMFS